MDPSRSLRIVVLGTGGMARTHAKNFASLAGVKIVGVCSRSRQRAAGFAEEIRGEDARPYSDFGAMLDHEQPDAVCVAIPPHAHEGQVVEAASRGLHLFVEKPLALHVEDAEAMVAAAEQAGVVTQVCYQFRFKQCVQRLAAAIAAGQAGRPTLFTGRFWVNMDGADWWRDVERSGGQAFEQLIHLYNLAASLLGEPVEVGGWLANLCHGGRADYTIEDTSVGTLRCANGAMAVITGSNCAVPMHFFGDFRVVFERITVDYQTSGQSWVEPDRALWYENGAIERIDESHDAHRAAAGDFVEAIRHGRPALCPIAEGLRDVRLIKTLTAAAERGGLPVA